MAPAQIYLPPTGSDGKELSELPRLQQIKKNSVITPMYKKEISLRKYIRASIATISRSRSTLTL